MRIDYEFEDAIEFGIQIKMEYVIPGLPAAASMLSSASISSSGTRLVAKPAAVRLLCTDL